MEEKFCTQLKRSFTAAMDLSQYPSTWALLFVGIVTIVVVVVSHGSRRKARANLPPGPRDLPIIGALLEMEPSFRDVLNKFAAKYGRIAFFRLGVQNLVVLSSAEAAEELLKHKDVEFCDRDVPMSRSASKYTCFNGTVLPFANYDSELKLTRKISATEFFTTAKMQSYEKLRTRETAVMVEKIFSVIQSSKDNGGGQDSSNGSATVRIRSIFQGEILNIIFSLCIGKRFDSLPPKDSLREFPEILEELAELFMTPNLRGFKLQREVAKAFVWCWRCAKWLPIFKGSTDKVDLFPWLTWLDPQGLLKRMKRFGIRQTKFYETILEANRRTMRSKGESGTLNDADEESSNNFVHVLLRAQENGAKISDDAINGTVLSMLSGGTDTTAYQLEWTLLEIVRHPKVLQRLQHELDVVVGKEQPLEEAHLQAMPFLNAVILESLRLYGGIPFTFPHVNMKPSTLCGYNIPAKTAVILNSYALGRDPRMWKDPLEFNPDRFMAHGSSSDPKLSPEKIKAGGNNYQLLPFGSGRRSCPGYNLAMVLLLRTTGSIVHAFDWSPPPGCAPGDLSIEETGAFLLHLAHELYLVPTPRLSCHVYKSNIL